MIVVLLFITVALCGSDNKPYLFMMNQIYSGWTAISDNQ
jgi:hypothetical protein